MEKEKMHQDQLTRKERVRLEAFAQVTARHQMRPLSLEDHMKEAQRVEAFLYLAEAENADA